MKQDLPKSRKLGPTRGPGGWSEKLFSKTSYHVHFVFWADHPFFTIFPQIAFDGFPIETEKAKEPVYSLHIGQFLQDLYPYLCLAGKEEREAGAVAGSEWSSLIQLWNRLCVCLSFLLSLSVSVCLFIGERESRRRLDYWLQYSQ